MGVDTFVSHFLQDRKKIGWQTRIAYAGARVHQLHGNQLSSQNGADTIGTVEIPLESKLDLQLYTIISRQVASRLIASDLNH